MQLFATQYNNQQRWLHFKTKCLRTIPSNGMNEKLYWREVNSSLMKKKVGVELLPLMKLDCAEKMVGTAWGGLGFLNLLNWRIGRPTCLFNFKTESGEKNWDGFRAEASFLVEHLLGDWEWSGRDRAAQPERITDAIEGITLNTYLFTVMIIVYWLCMMRLCWILIMHKYDICRCYYIRVRWRKSKLSWEMRFAIMGLSGRRRVCDQQKWPSKNGKRKWARARRRQTCLLGLMFCCCKLVGSFTEMEWVSYMKT